MKFSIINIKALSGEKAAVCTVKFDNKYYTELESFTTKFQDSHKEILDQIFLRIQMISKRNGIQSSFFKRESPKSHNVFRLLESQELRIYCILFDNVVLLFGSGGVKKKRTRKLDENPPLEREVNRLMKIEEAIRFNLKGFNCFK